MDSTASLALLQRYYAAFNAGDDRALVALLADGVIHDLNQGPREIGRSAFSAFMHKMRRCYAEQLVDIVLCVSPDGCLAAAEYVVLGRYLQSDEGLPPAVGQAYRLAGGAFFAIAEGQITRVTNYYNLQAWLSQVAAVAS